MSTGLISLLIFSCIFVAKATDLPQGAVPEDDEDVVVVAAFRLNFKISLDCNIWYDTNTNIWNFNNRLRQAVITGINQDCNNCGFQETNLEAEITVCREEHLTYGARIRNWSSDTHTVQGILDNLEIRYNNRTYSFSISTNGFGVQDTPLYLNETNATTSYMRDSVDVGSSELSSSGETMPPSTTTESTYNNTVTILEVTTPEVATLEVTIPEAKTPEVTIPEAETPEVITDDGVAARAATFGIVTMVTLHCIALIH